jgi:hypothetical protein
MTPFIPPTDPDAPRTSEHSEQSAVIQWAQLMEGAHPELELLFSTLNGIPLIGMSGKTRAVVIHHMKQEGLKRGVPDLFLMVPRKGYHGLVIEMKVGRNKPTEEQISWLDKLEAQGYRAVALWGAEEVIAEISEYLEIK